MKEIALTQGRVALVDDDDYPTLAKHRWYAARSHKTFYAQRSGDNQYGIIRMHREILGLTAEDKTLVDHRDLNGLNNQRSNLRRCSTNQNVCNQPVRSGRKYKGITYEKDQNVGHKRWRAQITVNGRTRKIGRFLTEHEAAMAYDRVAVKEFGEFARLNDICSRG